MSVPKDKRAAGELTINTMARGVCVYVLKITENEKNYTGLLKSVKKENSKNIGGYFLLSMEESCGKGEQL